LKFKIKIYYYTCLKVEAESLQEPYGCLGPGRDFETEVNKPLLAELVMPKMQPQFLSHRL
jgi:hypothetical protein